MTKGSVMMFVACVITADVSAQDQAAPIWPTVGCGVSGAPLQHHCEPLPDEVKAIIGETDSLTLYEVSEASYGVDGREVRYTEFGVLYSHATPGWPHWIRLEPLVSPRSLDDLKGLLLSPDAECDWATRGGGLDPKMVLKLSGPAGDADVYVDFGESLWRIEWVDRWGVPHCERRRFTRISSEVMEFVDEYFEEALADWGVKVDTN